MAIGRQTKLTPELQQRFCDALHSGLTFAGACDLVGIAPQTFHEWMARGNGTHERPCTPALAAFADAIKVARATRDQRYVKVIEDAAAGGTWTAAAWFLERTNRSEYGRNDSVEVTGAGGGPIKQQVVGDDERAEVTALIAELAARAAKQGDAS